MKANRVVLTALLSVVVPLVLAGATLSVLLSEQAFVFFHSPENAAEQQQWYEYLRSPSSPQQLFSSLSPEHAARYTEDERAHMMDVKRLIRTLQMSGIIALCLFFLSMFTFRHRTVYLDAIRYGSFLCFLLVAFLFFLAIVVPWELFFSGFHTVFFPQGNWAFPDDSYLLQLFPSAFWQQQMSAFFMVFIVLASALLITVNAYTFFHDKRRHQNSS